MKEYIAHVKVYTDQITIILYINKIKIIYFTFLRKEFNKGFLILKNVQISRKYTGIDSYFDSDIKFNEKTNVMYYSTLYVINFKVKLDINFILNMCNDSLNLNVLSEYIKLIIQEEADKYNIKVFENGT